LEFSASVGFIHKESVTMHGSHYCKKKTVHKRSEIKCKVCSCSQSGAMEDRVCEACKSKQAYD
jgi:hypothetical protein